MSSSRVGACTVKSALCQSLSFGALNKYDDGSVVINHDLCLGGANARLSAHGIFPKDRVAWESISSFSHSLQGEG